MKVKSQLIDAQLEARGTNPTKRGETVIQTADSGQVKYHDGSGVRTVANTDQAQTLTNKTHTSPVINTSVSGTAVLDEDNMASDSATQLATQQSIKAYADTKTAKATLTTKGDVYAATGASTPARVAVGSDGQVLTADSTQSAGVSWGDAAGGGGSKNYIDTISAELNSTIGSWTTDDGAGESASYLTLSRETSAPLAGGGSLKVAKSANDASGEYIKLTTQDVDLIDRRKGHLFYSMAFDCTDAAYVSGDFVLQFWDLSNDVELYAGATEDLEFLRTSTTANGHVDIGPTTESIEVRLKVNSTNASAYDLYFDEFKLGPAASVQTVYRKSATIDVTGSGDFTAGEIQVERVGNLVVVKAVTALTYASNYTPASADAVLPEWAIPVANTSNLYVQTGTLLYRASVTTAGAIRVYTVNYSGANTATTSALANWQATYTVPAVTGPTMNDNELSLQTVRVSGAGNGGNSITANVTNITFTEVRDSHGAWNGTQFTAPKTGYYKAQGGIAYTAGVAGLLYAYVDGTLSKLVSTNGNASYNFHKFDWSGYLEKGELLSFRGPAGTLSNSTTLHWIEISSLPDYTVIGAVKEKNKIQTKTLSADVTTNTTISDLTFSNLVIGKWYDVTGKLYFQLDVIVADSAVSVSPTHDSSILDYYMVLINESSDTSTDLFSIPVSFKFKATATSLTFVSSSTSTSSKIAGDNSRGETYIQLEERNDLVETSDF